MFDVHLLAITDATVSDDQLQYAQQLCGKISIYAKQKKPTSLIKKFLLRIGSLIPGRLPFKYVRYDRIEIENFIKTETKGVTYDVALCVLLDHLHLIKKLVSERRYTLDLIDSPYSTFIRSMEKTLVNNIDAYILRYWERKSLKLVDYACYISPLDRLIGSGTNSENIGLVPNGLFLQDHIEEKLYFGGKCLGYLGHMGYPPNITAALRLYRIYEKIIKTIPDLKLIIIGRNPSHEIIQLAESNNNVYVTGSVDNIWPYINGIDLFVFPMEIGSGQQNKLLEAMAAGRPVVSTSLGNSGIGAKHNEQIFIADTDEAIENSIIQLLSNDKKRDELAQQGQLFVHNNYYWPSIFRKVDASLLHTDSI